MKNFLIDLKNAINKYAIVFICVLMAIVTVISNMAAYTPNGTVVVNSNPNRSVNTSYDSDPVKMMEMKYTIVSTVTNPALAGSATAYAYLETSSDGGTTWVTTKEAGQTSSVGVAVVIALTNIQSTQLIGNVGPALKFRVRTAVTGTGSSVTMPTNRQEELTY